MKLLDGMEVKNGKLFVSGLSYEDLAKTYSTPLYVVDESAFKRRAETFKENFKSEKFKTRIVYASKAFLNLYMAGLVDELGLCLDVVSGGELYTALKADFDPEKIYFHGNNKSKDELSLAISEGVGRIIVDNEGEFDLIEEILENSPKKANVLLRLNPLIKTSTHGYIQTSNEDSKFGLGAESEKTYRLVERMAKSSKVNFFGIHCHIGSQVLDPKSFFQTAHKFIGLAKNLTNKTGVSLKEINLGGGFGVYYTKEDKPLDFKSFLPAYISEIEKSLEENGLEPELISIEPGRSLINEAGSTLYTVGQVKEMENTSDFIFVDGGMADNPRPSLYQASYEAGLVNKMDEENTHTYTIAGKCCESGDILIEDISLAEAKRGDLLLIPSTGAYNYSMSSNYNRLPRPAVVFVEDGEAKLVVKRESYDDLLRNDIRYKRKEDK